LSCLRIVPALLRNTDEFFLTASNQIVKDLRSLASASSYENPRRASKLGPVRQAAFADSGAGKIQNLKKNQTGRPYSAPRGGPRRVLLPFLAEDLYYSITAASAWQAPARQSAPTILNSVTCLEYQRQTAHASAPVEIVHGFETCWTDSI
jgi:hypothetical protein